MALLAGSLAEGLRSAGARLVHASAAIADLRAFNEHVINSLVSGLVTADTDGRILTFNRAAAAITSVPVPTAVGRHVGDVLGLPAPFRGRLGDLGETRGERIDFEYRTGDGRQIELGVTGARLAFPDGRIGYLFTFQDVTDVKKLERDAGRRQRLAAVGEMAAGIAHEIRNPLASMSGSMQVLRAELPLNEEQEQLMDIVLRESDRLNQTIRSFLAYARPQPSNIARFDVGQVMGIRRCSCGTAPTFVKTTWWMSMFPPNPCGTRPTPTRSARSCGTSPQTDCVPCPMEDAFCCRPGMNRHWMGMAIS